MFDASDDDIELPVPLVLTEASESSTITCGYGLERIAVYNADGRY